jgi:hypothetical protein
MDVWIGCFQPFSIYVWSFDKGERRMKFLGQEFTKLELFGIFLIVFGVNMWTFGIASISPFIGLLLLYQENKK